MPVKLRLPLYGQILLWLLLNLLIVGVVSYAFLRIQFRFGLDILLQGRTGERIQAATELLVADLTSVAQPQWSEVLQRFGDAYGVDCYLFRGDGEQQAGPGIVLPPEVRERIVQSPAVNEGLSARRGPPPGRGPLHRMGAGRLQHPKFIVRTTDPVRYWVGVRFPAPGGGRPPVGLLTLLLASDSLAGGGLLVDLTPWILVAGGVLLLSVLLWVPMVRSITRRIAQTQRATERIADGRFDVRVPADRADELGALAAAVNLMAERLDGYVRGQKRFLGDVAHELCSPLARMEMALGVLEQRADDAQRERLRDVQDEVRQMSQLVNDLLSFSRASLGEQRLVLARVRIAELLREAVARELPDDPSRVQLECDETLTALAEPDLLVRAVGNLVRNALRHAGGAGPITLTATAAPGQVLVYVRDNGPGIPESELGRAFEPFYRVESSRSRDTGGAGLGLAIVRTCLEAMGGRVTARNRMPRGLEVELVLQASAERDASEVAGVTRAP